MKVINRGKPRRIEELTTNVQKKLNCVSRKINIAITRIPNDYRDPSCRNNSQTIKNRISFGKAIKKAIELAKLAGIKRSSSTNCGTCRRKRNCTLQMD